MSCAMTWTELRREHDPREERKMNELQTWWRLLIDLSIGAEVAELERIHNSHIQAKDVHHLKITRDGDKFIHFN